MNSLKIPVIPLLSAVGVLLGGIVWLIVYATYFGVIEFDGPAGLALGLSLLIGGSVAGIAGIIYDLRHKKRVIDTLVLYIASIFISCFLIGFFISAFAQNHWGFAAANPGLCQAPEDERPLAC